MEPPPAPPIQVTSSLPPSLPGRGFPAGVAFSLGLPLETWAAEGEARRPRSGSLTFAPGSPRNFSRPALVGGRRSPALGVKTGPGASAGGCASSRSPRRRPLWASVSPSVKLTKSPGDGGDSKRPMLRRSLALV